jgi:Flp pilus assembly protein TadD
MKSLLLALICLAFLALSFGCSSGPTQTDSDQSESAATSEADKEDEAPVSQKQQAPTSKEYLDIKNAYRTKNERALVESVSKILAKKDNDSKALNAMGVFYLESRRPHLAKIIFLRLLKNNSNSATLHNNLGLVYNAIGEEVLAAKEYEAALEKDSRHVQANANLGSYHVKYRNYKVALPMLERAYEKSKDLRVANNYALALRGTGKIDDAEKVFSRVYRSKTRDVSALLNYASFMVEDKKNRAKGEEIINKIKFLSTDADIMKKVRRIEQQLSQLK